MTKKEMYERSFLRPRNFFKLTEDEQWSIDKQLGILDWDGEGLTDEELDRFWRHYEGYERPS